MSPTAQLQAFAQSVYLVIKNRYFDDITSTDGQDFINMVIDWTNQFLDELEAETTLDGQPVNWRWVRQNNYELGTATEGAASIPMPTAVNNLLTDEGRYVQILQGSSVISNWAVVSPNQISSKTDRITEDMCSVVGSTLVFSRAFRDTESNGTIVGDITTFIPRLSATNVKALSTVKPKQLLVLGVAKNASLPDIVQGGLSPSFVQKYNDLLQGAIIRDGATSLSSDMQRDDLGYIRGVY